MKSDKRMGRNAQNNKQCNSRCIIVYLEALKYDNLKYMMGESLGIKSLLSLSNSLIKYS